MSVSLVTCSGPSREEGLTKLLQSVLLRPGGNLVDRVAIGWPPGEGPPAEVPGGPYPVPVRFARDFLPRQLLSLAKAEAKEHGFAFWMRDDEVLLPDDSPVHEHLGKAAGFAPKPPPYPLGPDLDALLASDTAFSVPAPCGASVLFRVSSGRVGIEPRLIRSKFNPPFYFVPSNRPNPGGPQWPGYPILVGLVVEQHRFAAPKDAQVRVNVGAGGRSFSTWVSVDRDGTDVPDHLIDLTRAPLPFANGEADAIYMSHVLDHFNFFEAEGVVRECRRVLKYGGVLRVAVCNLGEFIKRYQQGGLEDFHYFQPFFYGELKSPGLRFGLVACGGSSDKAEWYSGHRMLYDEAGLWEMLERGGFKTKNMRTCDDVHFDPRFWDTDEPYPDHTLFVEVTA